MGVKYWIAVASSAFSQRIVLQLRTQVYDKLQRLSFSFIHPLQTGIAHQPRAAGDVQAIRLFIDGVVLKAVAVAM